MLVQGLQLMVVGMGVVFAFLTVLVLALALLAVPFKRLAARAGVGADSREEQGRKVAAAIGAAVVRLQACRNRELSNG